MKTSVSISDLEAIFQSAPYLVVILEPDFTIAAANDAVLQATNLFRDDLVGKRIFEVFPNNPLEPTADGEANLRLSLERVLATGRPDRMETFRYDIRSSLDPGVTYEERYWRSMNYPILDAQGCVTYLIHQSEDVTELVRFRNRASEYAAELIEANSLYQAIYDQGIFAGRIDLEGRVTDVNRSALEFCGFRREEVIGKPFWDCGWWNRSVEVQLWVKAAFEQAVRGDTFRGVSPYFCADGRERIVQFACMPIKDASGKVQFVVPTGIDITERFLAEKDQQATEILESITDAFFSLDLSWRFTYVNRQALQILGRHRNELLGMEIWDAYPGIAGTEFELAYRQAADEGVSSSITSYYPDHDRWYEVRTYPSADGISVYFRDVSDRMQAEAEREMLVAESEKQRRIYEVALSNTPDLVYVFDRDHRFVYANEALLKMWGVSREYALGKNCLELGYEPWHAAMHDREIEQVVATKQPIRGEVPFAGTLGRRIYDYIFAPVIGADGSVVAVAGTTRDVTERNQTERAIREQAEQLRQNDRSKDEFLAMLAHELRNPLAAIANAVTLATRGEVGDQVPWSMDVITRQMKHLTRLIDDLMDVSRITLGKIDLRKSVVDATQIVQSAAMTVRPLIESRNHSLEIAIDPGEFWVHADPTRLEQIVVNLLNNAAKYSDDGGKIRLSVRKEQNEVVISVRDTGVGIAPDALPRMFELFAQGDRSLARSEGGLGIGLTVVKKLVELHRGTVTAESDGPGKGSRFAIRFPLVERPAPGRLPSGKSKASSRSLRILVIDDNQDTARGMARLLKISGHEVETAFEGHEALEIAQKFRPEFVLLDIGLPGMDGYEVASRLRQEEYGKRAKIVAVSGYGQSEDRRRSKEAGFDYHLVKPLDHDILLGILSDPENG